MRRFLRHVAAAWRRRRDVYVSRKWLAQQEQAELKVGVIFALPWRWPFRQHLDYNGPRNRRLLRTSKGGAK